MIRPPPRSTRSDTTLSLHDALPIYYGDRAVEAFRNFCEAQRRSESSLAGFDGERLCDERYRDVAEPEVAARGLEPRRSEEHTSELQSLMRISYAVFCLKKKNK